MELTPESAGIFNTGGFLNLYIYLIRKHNVML